MPPRRPQRRGNAPLHTEARSQQRRAHDVQCVVCMLARRSDVVFRLRLQEHAAGRKTRRAAQSDVELAMTEDWLREVNAGALSKGLPLRLVDRQTIAYEFDRQYC